MGTRQANRPYDEQKKNTCFWLFPNKTSWTEGVDNIPLLFLLFWLAGHQTWVSNVFSWWYIPSLKHLRFTFSFHFYFSVVFPPSWTKRRGPIAERPVLHVQNWFQRANGHIFYDDNFPLHLCLVQFSCVFWTKYVAFSSRILVCALVYHTAGASPSPYLTGAISSVDTARILYLFPLSCPLSPKATPTTKALDIWLDLCGCPCVCVTMHICWLIYQFVSFFFFFFFFTFYFSHVKPAVGCLQHCSKGL